MGRGIASSLPTRCKVVVCDLDIEGAEATVADIKKGGGQAAAFRPISLTVPT